MKVVTNLFAIVAVALSCSVNAADPAPRHEAVLDTGKGGLHLVVSVPDFAQGPYDFAKNKGPKITTYNSYTYGELMFNAPIGDSSVVVYQATVMRDPSAGKGNVKEITADHIAQQMLFSKGFSLERAVKIDSPQVSIAGATIVTYKAMGQANFDGNPITTDKRAVFVTAVSFDNNRQGYALLAALVEKNVANFDANPEKIEKMARGGFKDMMKNSTVTLN